MDSNHSLAEIDTTPTGTPADAATTTKEFEIATHSQNSSISNVNESKEQAPYTSTSGSRRRKKPRCLYDERQMVAAVQMVEEGGASIMKAARHYGIPRATLWCRMKREYPCARLQTGPPSALMEDEEAAICQWVAAMTDSGRPQTFKALAMVVKEVLDSAGRRNVFCNNRPSEGWIGKFKKKHMHLFSKKPEATTLRDNITPHDVNKFYHELEYHLQCQGLDPTSFLTPQNAHRVFNLDECGVYIPNDDCLSKLVMRRSERCNLQGCGDSRQMVTAVSCGSGAGCYIRPLLVFKEARIPFKTGCPGVDNSSFNVGISELGWLDHKAFLYWLQHFDDQLVELGIHKPVLLLLDGHSAHVSVTALEYAKECGVILHQIPPHTSHLLQPVYLALYKQLKRSYREVLIENWPKDDKVINKKQFPSLFMEAWTRSTGSEELIQGYREAGIIPRDPAKVIDKLSVKNNYAILNHTDSVKSFKIQQATELSKQSTQRQEQGPQSSSISVSSLHALLSSKVDSTLPTAAPVTNLNTTHSPAPPPPQQQRQPPPPGTVDNPEFLSGLEAALSVVKEYIPPQVRSIYEGWIQEHDTSCTSDTLYHIWLGLNNKIQLYTKPTVRKSDRGLVPPGDNINNTNNANITTPFKINDNHNDHAQSKLCNGNIIDSHANIINHTSKMVNITSSTGTEVIPRTDDLTTNGSNTVNTFIGYEHDNTLDASTSINDSSTRNLPSYATNDEVTVHNGVASGQFPCNLGNTISCSSDVLNNIDTPATTTGSLVISTHHTSGSYNSYNAGRCNAEARNSYTAAGNSCTKADNSCPATDNSYAAAVKQSHQEDAYEQHDRNKRFKI